MVPPNIENKNNATLGGMIESLPKDITKTLEKGLVEEDINNKEKINYTNQITSSLEKEVEKKDLNSVNTIASEAKPIENNIVSSGMISDQKEKDISSRFQDIEENIVGIETKE